MSTVRFLPSLMAGKLYEPDLISTLLYNKISDVTIEKTFNEISLEDIHYIRSGILQVQANEGLLDSYIRQSTSKGIFPEDNLPYYVQEFVALNDVFFDPEFVTVLIYENCSEESYARVLSEITRADIRNIRCRKARVVANMDLWMSYVTTLSSEDTERLFGGDDK